MRRLLLVAALVLLGGASPQVPQQGLTLQVPASPLVPPPRVGVRTPPPVGLQPAPLPNRDLEDQPPPPPGTETSIRPGLFSRSDTYRGEGFSKGSSASSEQDRRAKPGVGFNLKMPLSPN